MLESDGFESTCLEGISNNDKTTPKTSYRNEISIPINAVTDTKEEHHMQHQIITWQTFQNSLANCMDVFTLRNAIDCIQELVKLENYLNNEFNLNEKDLYFPSQKKIIEYMNSTLKVI